ncbi:GNAT family N-acetyltransferase [Enterococcus sp. LJL99]
MGLIAVTSENEAFGKSLKVTQKQIDEALIFSVPDAIQLSKETTEKVRPFFIEAENEIIGFTMFAFDETIEEENYRYWLWQLMIDEKYQRKGLTKQVLPLVIDYFKNEGSPILPYRPNLIIRPL